MAIIYKTINLTNGKIYIGKSIKDDPTYLGSGLKIQKAIRKYGRKNFIREIIEECDETILDIRECYWIDELNATDSNIGYNISAGGTGGNHYWKTLSDDEKEEHRKKIAKALKGHGKRIYTPEKAKALEKGRNKFNEENRNNKEFHLAKGQKRSLYYVCIDLINKRIYRIKNLKNFCRESKLNYGSMVYFSKHQRYSINDQWCCFKGQFKELTDTEVLDFCIERIVKNQKISRLKIQTGYRKRDNTGSKNPNARLYRFANDDGREVEFNGNFEKDCIRLTGHSVDIMRQLVSGTKKKYKGWNFVA